MVGKKKPTGKDRIRKRDKGKPLAGKSTLNRLELTPVRANKRSRYKNITINKHMVDAFFVNVFLQSYDKAPSTIVLDLDATDDPIHGHHMKSNIVLVVIWKNRIKEQQLCLFADRTSAATMRASQLRLWFSSVAYTSMSALRRPGLKRTKLAKARCDTIRLKLLKIGAQIKVTIRKVRVSLSESYPYQQLFKQVYENLRRLCPIPLRC